jgi:two-component system sensor histidine kinase BaeS
MALSLQQLEGARRQWMADMSHELRTPLTVLRGEIDALIDGVMPLQPSAIKSLKDEVLQLNALVDDLHLLAMSDLKALPCYFEEFDIVTLLEKMVLRFTPRATQSGLSLKLEVITPSEKWVHWDAKRIEQLISNLIDNSLRYTDAPGHVVIKLTANSNHVTIGVSDSSPAVTKADLPSIFEPLFRADAARQRIGAGSGLGLAICSAIVQAHNGSIHATASDLGGLCVQIVLPWHEASSV